MQFEVTAGAHKAQITLTEDPTGRFVGTIATEAFGQGNISGRDDNGTLSGIVMLRDHTAQFTAKIEGDGISGRIQVPWPMSEFFPSQDFSGSRVG